MNTNNKIAKAIGALFLITMILGMIDAYTVAPLLRYPLSDLILHESIFYIGAFSILFMALGVVVISILFYPILERHNKLIAITYISARVMECLLLITGVIVYFLLLDLSQEFINAGSPDASYFQIISSLAVKARYSSYQIAMLILSLASMMLCTTLYKTRLIPRLISSVGFIGYAFVLLSAALDMTGIIDTTRTGGMLYIPGALFETLLLPGWLIVKGFNYSTTVS
ncbi:DUF4386 domain-containing protein [candidate division KSB1 bacterium]|nr:DUF4386 domain-containing protein [candidate division KSB1 bacterium]